MADIDARLAALPAPVRLVFFTQTFGCDTCLPARQLVDRIAAASDQITVQEHNFMLDKDEVAVYGIDRVPAIAIVGATDVGIRYYGIPTGFEVESVIGAIEIAANEMPKFGDTARATIEALDRDIRIQVFVTPT